MLYLLYQLEIHRIKQLAPSNIAVLSEYRTLYGIYLSPIDLNKSPSLQIQEGPQIYKKNNGFLLFKSYYHFIFRMNLYINPH